MQPTIALCLDVDQMLVNSECCDETGNAFDINGEDSKINMRLYDLRIHKPTLWYTSLVELKQLCAAKGVNLEIHIISAKMSSEIDDTIDAVVKILHPLLLPPLQNGTLIYQQMPNYYLYQTYLAAESKVKCAKNVLCEGYNPSFVEGDYHNQHILTNIHIPYGNGPFGITSKAAVMQQIEVKLRDQSKQPRAMILVDNQPGYGQAIRDSNKIDTCRYSFISAYELEHLQHKPMFIRSKVTLMLINKIKQVIEESLLINGSTSTIVPSLGYYNDGWSDGEASSDEEAGLF